MELKNNSQNLHQGTVEFVNGPVIKANGMRDFGMREVVKVGPHKLMGEIIKMDGDNATIGTPVVAGATVEANTVKNGKGKKIRIFKYNPKKGYRKRQGHRQPYTKVEIGKISV